MSNTKFPKAVQAKIDMKLHSCRSKELDPDCDCPVLKSKDWTFDPSQATRVEGCVRYEPQPGDTLACEEGCCYQPWDGHESLAEQPGRRPGDPGRHALTVLVKQATKTWPLTRESLVMNITEHLPFGTNVQEACAMITGQQPPKAEALARAMFDTDEEVNSYVYTRSDSTRWVSEHEVHMNGDKFLAAREACWRVNDKGFRAKFEARAKAIIGVIR